ncbi:hypothetical protein QN368_20620, partial [Undibacterium sp. CCC3.4]|nr:hypothetical protein [Undibacterium sp. CCC3.4]
ALTSIGELRGIAVDKSGSLYVANYGFNTILKIASDGTISTFAGKAKAAGGIDGTGSAARFYDVGALTIDQNGTLYVAASG